MRKITTLRIIHVDSNPQVLESFKLLIKNIKNVEYVNGFLSGQEAIEFLDNTSIDLVFADVDVAGYNGFWLAEKITYLHLYMIFITANIAYTLQESGTYALEYILKPLNLDKLIEVFEKARTRIDKELSNLCEDKVEVVEEYFDTQEIPSKIFINMVGKVQVVKLNDVLHFAAITNYTLITLINGEEFKTSKTIKTYEDILKGHPDFLRVGRSHIVNKNTIESIVRSTKTRQIAIVIANGENIETFFKTKEEVIKRLQ